MKPLDVSYEYCHGLLELCEPSLSDLEKQSGLRWRINRGGGVKKGDWAGSLLKRKLGGKTIKYWTVKINKKRYMASRIIYFMSYGVDPYPLEVDHIDINSLNNSVKNLRVADRVLQCQNKTIRQDNTSGVKGVSWFKQTSKWLARIQVDGENKNLGLYPTLKEAVEARNDAIQRFWPKEAWPANLVSTEPSRLLDLDGHHTRN